ncbi:hypothetical protein TKK_0004312 [Trichogramma kaykai]|uniref:F-box domain-containing protein n=1 Tax=Trichogramma kaykai TaxID=54128 RepID=A0ABD2XM28_9HYME
MFPVELWEQILANVDAKSLMRLKTVSKTWKLIIARHLQTSDAWYLQCVNSIPKHYWYILLEDSVLFPLIYDPDYKENYNETRKFESKIWVTIYKAWITWEDVEKLQVDTIKVLPAIPENRPQERITNIAVLGELVAVGSNDGFINVYNIENDRLMHKFDQVEEVTALKLTKTGEQFNKTIVLSSSLSRKNRMWIFKEKKPITRASGTVICSGYGYYCANTEVPYKFHLYNTKNQKQCNFSLMDARSGLGQTAVMNIYRHFLCLWTEEGIYVEIDLRKIGPKSNEQVEPEFCKRIGTPEASEYVRNYYLFNPRVILCVTEYGKLGISVNRSKWKLSNPFPFLGGVVTAVHYHVKVLIIGLDSGDVYLYPMKNEKSLLTFSFLNSKFKKLQITSEPIVSVNVTEVFGDQRLIVATKNSIFSVKFN